jgi:protoporphyrinogen oxidase
MSDPSQVHILGAGPAGLAAAYEASRRGHEVVVIERENCVGGLAKSFEWHGFVLDFGPHFFITNIPVLLEMWDAMLGKDQLTLKRETRVFWKGRLFTYPPRVSDVARSLSVGESLSIICSYVSTRCFIKAGSSTLAEQLIGRYGHRLFRMFFESYMEKLWGVPCSVMSGDWEAGRVYRSSLWQSFKAVLASHDGYFRYPLRGSGQLYEAMASHLTAKRSRVLLHTEVLRLEHADGKIQTVGLRNRVSGEQSAEFCSALISSIPLPTLLRCFTPECPKTVLQAAESLIFRSTVLVYLMVEDAEVFSGQCVYVNDSELRLGRVTNFANWSPGTRPNDQQVPLCCEFWCDVGDQVWNAADADLATLAERELRQIRLIFGGLVSDRYVVRLPRAHPSYRLGYEPSASIIGNYLEQFRNLKVAGRSGAFRYSDQDEVLAAGIMAAAQLTV